MRIFALYNCLGTDQLLPLDARMSKSNMVATAIRHGRKLNKLVKGKVSKFDICSGTVLNPNIISSHKVGDYYIP